ncbi:bifunctional 2-polyprenyl-6-hydroxyphenol methylase/3-demethylubiquinol 3-O-methyltransferase UbiG [Streptomyces sp. 8P21H-1]|uniref:class I SAM-dependent methyltransferase n=1 Tax=Streptomyces sp. 8P21H-1 TaxID=2737048 RepID=UPI001570AC42|nr:class I SAM-dependent methyltransferase [Streptomyces sp. 8P21H-1]NSL43107.1 class I SAM-dependent methyltransferase [Streptomyces sp. 8P21H-1]
MNTPAMNTPAEQHTSIWDTQTADEFWAAMDEPYERFVEAWGGSESALDKWLPAQLPGGERALDLNCGSGRHSVLLSEHYRSVLAVDISGRIIDRARKDRARPHISYEARGNLDVTPERDGLFDAVLSVYGFHMAAPFETALRHIRSLVAPGGVAVVYTAVDTGEWGSPDWHVDRAFGSARYLYGTTGDPHATADLLRFWLDPRWLETVAAAPPPTRDDFHRACAEIFPGCDLTDGPYPDNCAMSWRAPAAS